MRISPAVAFLLVWMIPLGAPAFLQSTVIEPISDTTFWLVAGTIIAFFAFQGLARAKVGRPVPDLAARLREAIDVHQLERKTLSLFKLWCGVYAVNIVFSGGVPLYWVLTGDPRTYVDFGLPTLGGLGNMLRAFVLACCYLLYFQLGTDRPRTFLWMGIALLFSAFAIETGRGNGVVLLLHPVAYYFMFSRLRLSHALLWPVCLLAFGMFLGYLQALRQGGDLERLVVYAQNAGVEPGGLVSLLTLPTLLYIAVPIVNTDLNVVFQPLLKFDPYYVFGGLVPTVFRDMLFEPRDYGTLVNEANNASSFFIPLVRDFGAVGAFIIAAAIHAVIAYVYARAVRGSLVSLFTWPALFMAVTLSFFYLFYTALVVVLYPLLAVHVANAVKRRPWLAAPARVHESG